MNSMKKKDLNKRLKEIREWNETREKYQALKSNAPKEFNIEFTRSDLDAWYDIGIDDRRKEALSAIDHKRVREEMYGGNFETPKPSIEELIIESPELKVAYMNDPLVRGTLLSYEQNPRMTERKMWIELVLHLKTSKDVLLRDLEHLHRNRPYPIIKFDQDNNI